MLFWGGLTAINLLLNPWLGYWSVALIYLLGMMGLALYLETGPVLVVTGLSAFFWNFLFIPPLYTLYIQHFQDFMMCGVYFCVALMTTGLMSRIRHQEWLGRQREARLALLYRFSEALARAHTFENLWQVAQAELQAAVPFSLWLLKGESDQTLPAYPLDEREWTAAQWALKHRRPAGFNTDTLPTSKGLYVPVFTSSQAYAVLQVQPEGQAVSFDLRQLLEMLCMQLGLALEHHFLQEQATQTRISQVSENLYRSLLNSVSHELRTPLTAIQGSVENLRNAAIEAQTESRMLLLDDLQGATLRLNHLVANLLDMSRLQSGKLELHRDWCDVGDILRAAIKIVERELQSYPLKLSLPSELPPIQADFGLLEQCVLNLLHNAFRYTPVGTSLELGAEADLSGHLRLWLRDQGPGIAEDILPHIFETFYRGQPEKSGGTGLGLSICKGLVEAHGGKISVTNLLPHGACFEIILPLSPMPALPFEEEM